MIRELIVFRILYSYLNNNYSNYCKFDDPSLEVSWKLGVLSLRVCDCRRTGASKIDSANFTRFTKGEGVRGDVFYKKTTWLCGMCELRGVNHNVSRCKTYIIIKRFTHVWRCTVIHKLYLEYHIIIIIIIIIWWHF